MPRRPSLAPKRTTDPDYPWVVNLPASLSSSGRRRERRYFTKEKQADEFAKQQRIRLENYGTASQSLPAGKVEEAVAAFDKLNGTGATLTEAVEHFVEWHRRRSASSTFGALMEKFAAAKASRSDPYRAQIRQTASAFAALNSKSAIEVTDEDIDSIATTVPPTRRNSFLRVIRAAYNLGIRKRWCQCDNPVLRLDFSEERRNTTLLTNEQVRTLLSAAIESDLALLPYLLFTIFAGVRPDEASWTTWDDVNWPERYVRISEDVSKTGRRRIIYMEPTLVRWLNFYRARGGSIEGPIAPTTNFRKRVRAVRKRAGMDKWPADAPRRTYASNHLAHFNEEEKLCRYLGHTTPTMLRDRYDKVVTRKDARQFWSINPPPPPATQKRKTRSAPVAPR